MAIFVVNNLTDTPVDGQTSLREAIALADANPGSTITFDPEALGGTPQTITLTQGELDITAATTIAGPGAGALSIGGDNASRIFDIDDRTAASIAVSISGLTLTGGNAGSDGGGAIYNAEDLTLTDCTVSGNLAAIGGGIDKFGTLNMIGCTVSGNQTVNRGARSYRSNYGAYSPGGYYGLGGGICIMYGTAMLTNCTIAGNSVLV